MLRTIRLRLNTAVAKGRRLITRISMRNGLLTLRVTTKTGDRRFNSLKLLLNHANRSSTTLNNFLNFSRTSGRAIYWQFGERGE